MKFALLVLFAVTVAATPLPPPPHDPAAEHAVHPPPTTTATQAPVTPRPEIVPLYDGVLPSRVVGMPANVFDSDQSWVLSSGCSGTPSGPCGRPGTGLAGHDLKSQYGVTIVSDHLPKNPTTTVGGRYFVQPELKGGDCCTTFTVGESKRGCVCKGSAKPKKQQQQKLLKKKKRTNTKKFKSFGLPNKAPKKVEAQEVKSIVQKIKVKAQVKARTRRRKTKKALKKLMGKKSGAGSLLKKLNKSVARRRQRRAARRAAKKSSCTCGGANKKKKKKVALKLCSCNSKSSKMYSPHIAPALKKKL